MANEALGGRTTSRIEEREEEISPARVAIKRRVVIPGMGLLTLEGSEAEVNRQTDEELIARVQAAPEVTEEGKKNILLSGKQIAGPVSRRLTIEGQMEHALERGDLPPGTPTNLLPGEVTDQVWARTLQGLATNTTLREEINSFTKASGLRREDIGIWKSPNSPNEFTIMVRTPDGWMEVDNPTLTTLSDIAEVTPDVVPAILAQFGALYAAGRMGLGFVGRQAATFLAQAGTFGAESELRRITGGEQTPRDEVAGEALLRAGIDTGFNVLGEIGSSTYRTAFGRTATLSRSVREVSRQADDFMREARARGEKAGDIQINVADALPLTRALGNIAARLGEKAEARFTGRLADLNTHLERYKNRILPKGDDIDSATIDDFLDDLEKSLNDLIEAPLQANAAEAAAVMGRAVETYRHETFERIHRLNQRAARLQRGGDLPLRTEPHQKHIGRLRTDPQTNVARPFTEGELISMRAARVPGDPPISRQAAEQGSVEASNQARVVGSELNPKLDAILGQFETQPLAGIAQANNTSPLEQVLVWKVEMMNFLDGSGSIDELVAKEFDNVLNSMLDDAISVVPTGPRGGGPTRQFRKTVNEILETVDDFGRTVDQLNVREIVRLNRSAPQRLGATLINPEFPDRVDAIRKVFIANKDPQGFNRVVDGYERKLLRDPASIEKELAKWDRANRRGIFSQRRERDLKSFARDYENFQGLERTLKDAEDFGADAFQLVMGTSSINQSKMMVQALGGRNSVNGRKMRAGIIEHILRNAGSEERGLDVIDPGKVTEIVKQLKASGKAEIFFTPEDLRHLEFLPTIGSFLPAGTDLGAGLIASETAQKAINPNPLAAPQTALTGLKLGRIKFMSWAFTNKTAKFLFRKGAAGRLIPGVELGPIKSGSIRDVGLARPLAIMGGKVWQEANSIAKRTDIAGKSTKEKKAEEEEEPGFVGKVLGFGKGAAKAGIEAILEDEEEE